MSRAKPRRQSVAPAPVLGESPAPTGPARYTAARFLSDCTPETREFLVGEWSEGNQLEAGRVPVDALPAVVILACYARGYGVEITDNYETLLDRYWEHVEECWHPDKFFASCIIILDETGQVPSDEAYETIRIGNIYEELFP